MRVEVLIYGCAVIGVIIFLFVTGNHYDQAGVFPSGMQKKVYELSYPAKAGIIGGQSVLFSKAR